MLNNQFSYLDIDTKVLHMSNKGSKLNHLKTLEDYKAMQNNNKNCSVSLRK